MDTNATGRLWVEKSNRKNQIEREREEREREREREREERERKKDGGREMSTHL